MSTPGLEVDGLASALLAPTSFVVPRGHGLAVRGLSGSGKTLLLRAVADLDPNEGCVRQGGIDRESVPGPAWRRAVRYVAAEAGWWADRVGDHFRQPARQVPALEAVGLDRRAMDWPVARLSTGERQRLAFLRAVEDRPAVLLLDEPTAGLDAAAEQALEAMLRDLMAAGTTLLLVTHDDAQEGRLTDGRLVMAGGRAEAAA